MPLLSNRKSAAEDGSLPTESAEPPGGIMPTGPAAGLSKIKSAAEGGNMPSEAFEPNGGIMAVGTPRPVGGLSKTKSAAEPLGGIMLSNRPAGL
jgi:hypothetical protein